jgi:TetR/AcrR family transcriptional regulator, tetracycline repressor protein
MGSATTKPIRGKGLNRTRVIDAALDLVDREGLGALNFRRLAGELGVTTMASYSHFAGKEDLLDAMITHVLGGLEERLDPTAPWDVQVEQAMVDLHDELDRHPGVTDLIVARAEGERLNELREALMDVTQSAGLGEIESTDALRALVSYVVGFVVLTRRAPIKVRRGSPHAFETGLELLMDSLRRKVSPASTAKEQ